MIVPNAEGRVKTFKLSNNSFSIQKMGDIVALYLNPTHRAVHA